MNDHDDSRSEAPGRDDERLWKTARAAFLDRYSRSPNLTPEAVAKWAVEGAMALHREYRLQSTEGTSAEKERKRP